MVLVKDDRELHTICQMLGTLAMDVCTAHTGGDALLSLEEQPANIVAMELQLPDMHGYELIAKVREIGAVSPIYVICAGGTKRDGSRSGICADDCQSR